MTEKEEITEPVDCIDEARDIIKNLDRLLSVEGTSYFALRHEGARRIVTCLEGLIKLAEE
jgi:hypothetical protein